ncbi:MAG: (Fe-S)-binding protein [Candidatus Helarchaeota archaeon]
MEKLKDLEQEMLKCVRCGKCRDTCRTLLETDEEGDLVPTWESRSSRGRVRMALGLVQEKIPSTPRLIQDFYNCLLCNRCVSTCPSGVDVPKIIEGVRGFIVGEDLAPPNVKALLQALDETRNIFEMDQDERLIWTEMEAEEIMEDKVLKEADLCFFVGCQASFKGSLAGIPEAIALILDSLNINFTVLGEEEWCCGNPYFLLGLENEKAKELVSHNIEKMQELKVKQILTTCPGCFRVWTKIYPKIWGQPLPFEIIHSTQFFSELIDKNHINIPKKLQQIVGYQDPCELGRHCGIYEEPRKILNHLAGSNFKELPLNRDDSNCCGGGGLAKAVAEKMTLEIARFKLHEFLDIGSNLLVTACPACYENLMRGLDQSEEKIEIKDVNQLLAELLDLS